MTTTAARDAQAGEDPAVVALPWLLRRVSQRYRRLIAEQLATAGLGDLPRPGYWALVALDAGVHEPGRLAAEMGVSKQAVSKLVDGLVERGFVDRRPDESDRRRSRLLLTARGTTAVGVIRAAARASEAQLQAVVGPEALALLTTILELLARSEG